MRTDIYLILTFDIKSDRFETLSALVHKLTKSSRDEYGCLSYEFTVNKDQTKAYMIEHFQNSSLFVDHIVNGFTPHTDEWNKSLTLINMVVMGNASEELRNILPPDAIYTDHVVD